MPMAPYKSGGGAQHRGGMLPLTVPHVLVPAMLVAGPRMLRAMKLKKSSGPSKKKKAASSKTAKSAPSKSKKKKSSKSKK
jgi:hypothetical protein